MAGIPSAKSSGNESPRCGEQEVLDGVLAGELAPQELEERDLCDSFRSYGDAGDHRGTWYEMDRRS